MSIERVTRKPKGSRFPVVRFRVRIRSKLDNGEFYRFNDEFDTEAEARRVSDAQWSALRSGAIQQEILDTIKNAREPSVADLLEKHQKATYEKRAVSGRDVERKRLLDTIPGVFVFLGRFPDHSIFKNDPASVESPKGHLFRFGDLRLTKCDSKAISAWLDARGKEVGEDTLKRELGLLSASFEKARKYYPEFPVDNPVFKLDKEDRPKSGSHRERILSPEEERRLFATLDASRSAVKDIVRVALGTGMRQSEILHLNWNRVDLENRTIRLDEDKSTRSGWRTVSRTVGMFPLAYETLLALWEKEKKPESGLVFGFTPEGFKASWKRLLAKSGLVDFRFHDLRHTAITRAASSGLSVIQTASVFGIRDAEHLRKIAFNSEDARKATEKAARGETLSANEVLAVGGHRGLRTAQRYANVSASTVAVSAVESVASASGSAPARVRVKKDGDEFVASALLPDGSVVEAVGSSVAEAKSLLSELLES